MTQKYPLAICRRCYWEFDGYCAKKHGDVEDNDSCEEYERKYKQNQFG